jgi:hypothetical protein
MKLKIQNLSWKIIETLLDIAIPLLTIIIFHDNIQYVMTIKPAKWISEPERDFIV